jgi:opacity protein-like surface antigen
MNKMPNIRTLSGLAVLGVAASLPAMAQQDYYRAPWQGDFWGTLGASVGESKFSSDCADVFPCDRRDTAFRIFSGGRMSNVFGLEAAYTDFGRVSASGGDTKAWAAGFTLLAGVPIDRFSVFGKLGGHYARTHVSAVPEALVDTGVKTGFAWSYGVGGGYNITKTLQLRVDWDQYKLDFAGGRHSVDTAMAGLAIRF